MTTRGERAHAAILKVLSESDKPLGAARIQHLLLVGGTEIQPRTIRFHTQAMDRLGLTEQVSRRAGRLITARGREELARANVFEKVGMVGARVDALSYRMTFMPAAPSGTVVTNVSMIYPQHLTPALVEMKMAFRQQYGVASRVVMAQPGDSVAQTVVPEDYIGIGTICSVAVSGILLRAGIPVTPRFGGLLEIRDRRPVRFVELIEYSGSSLDPLEVFIQANMTRVRDAIRRGSGVICAGFREVPSVALEDARRLVRAMRGCGIGGLLEFGQPNQPLFGIPVAEGRTGLVVAGGLNAIAAVHEAGIPVRIQSMAGLHEFSAFKPVETL